MSYSKGDHLKVREGDLIDGRYKVIREVGCGNFSKVYCCYDASRASEDNRQLVAAKIVKREYREDASFEKQMLRVLRERDFSGTACVCQLIEFFEWKRCPVLIMSIHGSSLYSRRLGYGGGVVTRNKLVQMAYSLIETLNFVHFNCRIVHTDIKPENILLDSPGHSKVSIGDKWILCDFGNASHWRVDRLDSCLISTRPYRAPEVILGMPWFYAADMWSMGCVLFEVATGQRLFDVRDDNTHLQLMEKRLGSIPDHFTRKSKNSAKYFTSRGTFLVLSDVLNSSKVSTRSIEDVLCDDPELYDLIRSMLIYDPVRRITAKDALRLPIFNKLRAADAARSDQLDRVALHLSSSSLFPRQLSAPGSLAATASDTFAVAHGKSAVADSTPPPSTKEAPDAHLPLIAAEVAPPHTPSPPRPDLLRKFRGLPAQAVRSPADPRPPLAAPFPAPFPAPSATPSATPSAAPSASAASPLGARGSDRARASRDQNGAVPSDGASLSGRRARVTHAPPVGLEKACASSRNSSTAASLVPSRSVSFAVKTPVPLKEGGNAQGRMVPRRPSTFTSEGSARLTSAATRRRVMGSANSRNGLQRTVSPSTGAHAEGAIVSRLHMNSSSTFVTGHRGAYTLPCNTNKVTVRQPTAPPHLQNRSFLPMQRRSVPPLNFGLSTTATASFLLAQPKALRPETPRKYERTGTACNVVRNRRACRARSFSIPIYRRTVSQGRGRIANCSQPLNEINNNDGRIGYRCTKVTS